MEDDGDEAKRAATIYRTLPISQALCVHDLYKCIQSSQQRVLMRSPFYLRSGHALVRSHRSEI